MTNKNPSTPLGAGNKAQELLLIKQLLQSAQKQIEEARRLFEKIEGKELPKEAKSKITKIKTEAKELQILKSGKIIEGIFDGQNMQGADSKTYPVPPNYASKSKLIEGDEMKLTLMPDGSFVFKQIAPAERKRIIGQAIKKDDQFMIEAERKLYKVLSASATYYKIEEGDKVTVVVPKKRESSWCAVENVIKKVKEGILEKVEDIEELKSSAV